MVIFQSLLFPIIAPLGPVEKPIAFLFKSLVENYLQKLKYRN